MLRDATRTMESAYHIPIYGTKHSIPDMKNEVDALAKALHQEQVQQYMPQRSMNNVKVRDLFGV
jgi:hypothetical protein